jgi:hypothetical protein
VPITTDARVVTSPIARNKEPRASGYRIQTARKARIVAVATKCSEGKYCRRDFIFFSSHFSGRSFIYDHPGSFAIIRQLKKGMKMRTQSTIYKNVHSLICTPWPSRQAGVEYRCVLEMKEGNDKKNVHVKTAGVNIVAGSVSDFKGMSILFGHSAPGKAYLEIPLARGSTCTVTEMGIGNNLTCEK